MNAWKYIWGWLLWHVKAGFWYLGLAFRLFFAIGLDRDFDPSKEDDMSRHFKYQGERTYLRYGRQPGGNP